MTQKPIITRWILCTINQRIQPICENRNLRWLSIIKFLFDRNRVFFVTGSDVLMDSCSAGPVLTHYPNHVYYFGVKLISTEILRSYRYMLQWITLTFRVVYTENKTARWLSVENKNNRMRSKINYNSKIYFCSTYIRSEKER